MILSIGVNLIAARHPLNSSELKGGGYCEDFAIAKYFILKALGVALEKMRLMDIRALKINQPHMVLIYSETVDQIPLVLDNINKNITGQQM